MIYLTRRDLLRGLAKGALGYGIAHALAPRFSFAAGSPTCIPNSGKNLIVITLGGGADPLELLPFAPGGEINSIVSARRPDIASRVNSQITAIAERYWVNQSLGLLLHPALAPLYPEYVAGRMKVIYGYGNPGYPDMNAQPDNLSHEYMGSVQSFGTTAFTSLSKGWLARVANQFCLEHDQVMALGITSAPELKDQDHTGAPFVVAKRIDNLAYQPFIDQLGGSVEANKVLAAAKRLRDAHIATHPDDSTAASIARGLDTMDESASFFSAINAYSGLQGAYSTSNVGLSLQGVAKTLGVVGGDNRNRIFSLAYTDAEWDSHRQQDLTGAAGDLAANLSAFISDLQLMGRYSNTLIMTTSEFGRKIYQNGDLGSDHGTGGIALALGGSVSTGANQQISHGLLVNSNLSTHNWAQAAHIPVAVHFQNLFGAALKWMGYDPDAIYDPTSYQAVPVGLSSSIS